MAITVIFCGNIGETHMVKLGFAASVALVVTVNAAPVEQLWERRYNGQASREDVFSALTVDVGGRVYVTGSSDNNVNPDPYGTVKYDTNGTRLWEARYTGPRAIDVPLTVVVDGQGYVYVTGFSHGFASGYDPDYATIKYAPEGTELWVARYNGAGTNHQSPDNPMAMLVNAAGEVYVTGTSMSPQQTLDFATIKYNTNGTELWVARYNGPAGYADRATAMGMDGAGNIYVCGSSEGDDNKARLVLLKYSPAGTLLWESSFGTPDEGHELMPQMKVDPSGKAHIAFTLRRGNQQDARRLMALQYNAEGELLWRTEHRLFNSQYGIDVVGVELDDAGNICAAIRGVGTSYYDYLVWKVSGAGESLWTSRYNSPSGYQDVVGGMALDGNGNIYVTGTAYTSGNQYQFTTIKLRPDGQREWETTTGHSDNFGMSLSGVRVDAAGHVYVGGSAGPVGTKDYVTIKYRQLPQPGLPEITAHPAPQSTMEGGSATFSVTATGEGLEYQWHRDGIPLPDATGSTLVLTNVGAAALGYYYVEVSNSGGTVASTEALLNVVLAPGILEQPVSRQVIAGSAVEFEVRVTGSEPLSFQWLRGATAIPGATNTTLVISNVQPADAASYTVVVTNIAGSATSQSATLSLVPGLEQLFAGTFRQSGQSYNSPQVLRVGTDEKAHLAQTLQLANQSDFLTVQFDTNGVPTWSARYALGTNRANYLATARMDQNNNIYVAGTGGENGRRFLTAVKYGPAGNQLWEAAHDTTRTNTYDTVSAMAVDAAGNVYVTGGTESDQIYRDFLTVKFDANGVKQWAVRYTLTDTSTDSASAIQVDATGVYVFGLSYQEKARLVTIKYDHTGTVLWTRSYDCGGGYAAAMKLDAMGNVIVTGAAAQPETDADFVTLKYRPNGDLLWIAQFTGMTDAYDYAYALDLDAAGNAYVAGRSSLPNEENTGLSAFTIVKYDTNGNQLWVSSEIGAGSEGGIDSFAVDAAGSAYRLLSKYHEDSGSDLVTTKFDANGTRLWQATATRGKYSDEYVGALALAPGGDLLVSGFSYHPVSELLLFRYRQSEIVGLPVITESPRSRDVIIGASVTFNVTATGTGLSYQWYFNGRPIGGAVSPSYTVTSAAERNAGFYAVEVRNAVGSVLSATAVLSIGVPPEITQQPRSQSILPGADVTFEAMASGSKPLSYQWRHNGTNIPGAFGAALELFNVQLEQVGNYSVVVSNRAGVVMSVEASLTVTRQARREWLTLFSPGPPQNSYPVDMELDAEENVYVAGNWLGMPLPQGYLTAKFSPAGEQLWAQKFVPNDIPSYAGAVAVDLAGNAYTVGEATGSNGVRAVVVVKYAPNGDQLWTRQVVRPDHFPIQQDITLSLGGNLYIASTFRAAGSSQVSLVTVGYDTNGVQLWSATQALSGTDTYVRCKVLAHSNAEVYALAQTTPSTTGRDVVAIRYNAAGAQVWYRHLAEPADQRLVDAKIDAGGDLVIVAHANGFQNNRGFLTLKLRSTDGEVQWKRVFALSEYGMDEPYALEIDYTRNIYVTGKAYVREFYDNTGHYHHDEDVLTIKYDAAGELQWVATFGAPAGYIDIGRSIAWDGLEGLYITGSAGREYGARDLLTLRYDTDGNRYWSDIYDGPGGGEDYGVAVRARGTNAYVLGLIGDSHERVGLFKYSDAGPGQVPTITTGPQSQVVIAGNNVTLSVVAGGPGPLRYQWYHNGSPILGATAASVLLPQVESTNAGNYSVEISNDAGAVVSPNALLKVVIPARIVVGPQDQCVVAGSHVQFQVQAEGDGEVGINWYYNGAPITASYYYLTITNATAANAGLYTVVVTNLYGSASASARLTISPQAALAWSARYNSTNSAHDVPEAAVVDAQGNTYVLGNSARGTVLLKYASTGALEWERWNVRTSYIMFAATELALAPDGSVYVAGSVQGPMENEQLLSLAKYHSNGDDLWAAEYSAAEDFPRPVDMKVDAAGNVCIIAEAGPDRYIPSEFLTLKFDADGNRLWARRLDYSDGQDMPVAVAVDPAGNVYVTGYSAEPDYIEYAQVANYLTVKYDAAGNQLWTAEHSGPGGADDRPSAIAVDAQGNVYVTGRHSAEYWVNSGTTVYFDYDYATIKYDTNGNQQWVAVYSGAPRQPDEAVDLKVDAAGNAYVLGQSDNDIVTVKYDTTGAQQWVTRFDSGFDYDIASKLVLDDLGNAYVTGHSGDYGDILTCKLDSNGSRIWVARFDGRQPGQSPSGSFDYPVGVGLDAAGNVYVAGSVDSPTTDRDFIVLRYTVASSPGSPVITVPPEDTAVAFGGTATLSVTATGAAPLRYQWRRNGIALGNETNAVLQIPEVTFAEAGQYSVVVHNDVDFTVSAEAALIVTMPEMVQCVHVGQTDNGVRLIVAGPAACTYRVECTADFVTWQTLGTVYNHNGTCEYLDATPASTRRFYRVVKLPH